MLTNSSYTFLVSLFVFHFLYYRNCQLFVRWIHAIDTPYFWGFSASLFYIFGSSVEINGRRFFGMLDWDC